MDSIQPVKIAVVGAGHVGASFAYALLLHGLATEIVLIDSDRTRAEGEAMDLQYTVPFAHPTEVRAGTLRDTGGAAITVICSGVRQQQDQPSAELLRRNSAMLKEVVPQVAEVNPQGLILVAAQPVDVLTYGAWLLSGLPRHQIMGAGTLLDTATFRYLLGRHLKIDPESVHAYILGGQGDLMVPVWSSATVAGMLLTEICSAHGCAPAVLEEIYAQTHAASSALLARKGSSSYAIGAGLVRVVASILRDENRIFSISSVLQEEYGLSNVALSVPTVVGHRGVERILKMELNDLEVAELLAAGKKTQEWIHEACFVVEPRMKAS
ncbi:MAG: L-lactate dehydrogenase [Acidobacteriia bacterium]|nr:L-lactate dehydrogenase [Terriglobia bacterium]